VYDALNVLMAMDIIRKDKKEIRWVGLPTSSLQELRDLDVLAMTPPQAEDDREQFPQSKFGCTALVSFLCSASVKSACTQLT